MQLHIPPPGPAADGAAGTLYRLPKCSHHVFPELLDKFAGKGSLLPHHAVTLQRTYVFGHILCLCRQGSMHSHWYFLRMFNCCPKIPKLSTLFWIELFGLLS